MNIYRLLLVGAAATALSACTAGQTSPPATASVNVATAGVLQFTVGTANLAGAATGMNFVSTYRQASGASAVLVNTPGLSGPFTVGATAGLTANETGAATPAPPACSGVPCIGGSPQQIAGVAAPFTTTLGTTGGQFGIGLAPSNYTSGGTPNSYTPYSQPFYTSPAGLNKFTPWGGPPAYDPNGSGKGTRDGTFGSLLGVDMGINVFAGVTPGAGTYTYNVLIPTLGGNTTVSATRTIGTPTLLPTATAPTPTINADGSVSVAYTLPAGVTGAYVQVQNSASATCGTNTGTYYTFWVTTSGTSTIANANAPGSKVATPSGNNLCTMLIGFDYNHYAITYNQRLGTRYPQTPSLPAVADVTISPTGITPIP